MPSNIIKWTCILAASFMLTACGGSGNTSTPEKTSSVSMQFDVSAFLQQSMENEARSSGVKALAIDVNSAQLIRGEMSATAIGGNNNGQSETFPWTIYLDEDTLEAASNNTLVLPPGNYDFELLLTSGNQQYAGYINADIIDGENDLSMIIKPVIGDGILNVNVIDQMAFFKFQYDQDELASLTDPNISIQVDNGAEQIFAINPLTGMSNLFVNLPAGSHDLKLKLYDGGVQVGKSITEQESQTITYGTDLNMDIVPLHGEVQFILTEDGGDASLNVNIPAEVVDEVGGVNNLSAALALVGIKNPLQESALTFYEQPDGSYKAVAYLTDLQYEDVAVSVRFVENSSSEEIAVCNANWELSSQSEIFTCDISLLRRAVITGNIMAVLGVNVFDEGGPVSGAVITDEGGNILGISGSGPYGTNGYLKLYMKPGNYMLTATDPQTQKVQTVMANLSSLDIENVQFHLATAHGFTGDFAGANWIVTGVAPHTVTNDEFRITVGNHMGNIEATITILTAGTINFDWVFNVNSPADFGDSILYYVNDTPYSLAVGASASGMTRDVKVEAGDQFKLAAYGSNPSSSYTALFNNFNFIAD